MKRPLLVLLLLAGLAVAAPPPALAQSASPSASAMVVDIPQDDLYHRPVCPLVQAAGSKVRVMRQGEAERRGMKPHDCPLPGGDDAERANAREMYIQEGDKRYHKAACERLGDAAKKTTLDEAAQGRWPCPVCKPPVRKAAPKPAARQEGAR